MTLPSGRGSIAIPGHTTHTSPVIGPRGAKIRHEPNSMAAFGLPSRSCSAPQRAGVTSVFCGHTRGFHEEALFVKGHGVRGQLQRAAGRPGFHSHSGGVVSETRCGLGCDLPEAALLSFRRPLGAACVSRRTGGRACRRAAVAAHPVVPETENLIWPSLFDSLELVISSGAAGSAPWSPCCPATRLRTVALLRAVPLLSGRSWGGALTAASGPGSRLP